MRSLEKSKESDFELIIVDNGSSNKYVLPDQEFRFPVRLIRSEKNLGFAGGNELGLREAKGDYLLLINNDTEVEDYFHTPLVEVFKAHPKLGMVSPLLRFFDTRQIQYAGATPLSPITLRNRGIGNMEMDDTPYKGYRPTGFIHGAAVMIPKAVYQAVGGMWEPYFLYYEEYDWCTRVRDAGFEIGFLGDVTIWHKESASVGRMSPLKIEYMFRNRMLYARRNLGAIAPLTLLYLAGPVAVRDTIKYVFSNQRNLIRPLWKGVRRGLTDRSA